MEAHFDAKARLFDPASPLHAHAFGGVRRRRRRPRHGDASGRRDHRQRRGASGRLDRRDVVSLDSGLRWSSPPSTWPACTIGCGSACRAACNVANALLALVAIGVCLARAGLPWAWAPPRSPAGWNHRPRPGLWPSSTTPTSLARCGPCWNPAPARGPAVVVRAGAKPRPGQTRAHGEVAAELADLVVVTDDNPATRIPRPSGRPCWPGGPAPDAAVVESPTAGGYRVRRRLARRGDVVVIAGRGTRPGRREAARPGVRRPRGTCPCPREPRGGRRKPREAHRDGNHGGPR